MPPILPEEFLDDYEAELRRWLRRRVVWFCIALAAFWAGTGVLRTLQLHAISADTPAARAASLLSTILKPAMHLAALAYVLRTPPARLPRRTLVWIVTALVIAAGAISVLTAPFIISHATFPIRGVPPETAARMQEKMRAIAPLLSSLVVVFLSHFTAALFIPWSPREALRPLLWLLVIAGVGATLESRAPIEFRLVFLLLLPLAGLPGFLMSWWRYARFRRRFGQSMAADRYGELKRELVSARQIHEALFPPPLTRGPIRLAYRYEPMRQIGGDFLYAFPVLPAPAANDGSLSVVLIDVTGHGVPAALTVNRLHGELERLFLEHADTSPGRALAALNRYAAVMLARHSVYPTALCLRADPAAGLLRWASAGHPPAFLRRADGRVETLDSTTLPLGVADADLFDPGEQSVPFNPGDALLAFTDGASEALNSEGAMLRPEGIRRAAASADPHAEGALAAAVLAAVKSHRAGPPSDDTLIVELRRTA